MASGYVTVGLQQRLDVIDKVNGVGTAAGRNDQASTAEVIRLVLARHKWQDRCTTYKYEEQYRFFHARVVFKLSINRIPS
jgi:hypothetical protein